MQIFQEPEQRSWKQWVQEVVEQMEEEIDSFANWMDRRSVQEYIDSLKRLCKEQE